MYVYAVHALQTHFMSTAVDHTCVMRDANINFMTMIAMLPTTTTFKNDYQISLYKIQLLLPHVFSIIW